MRGQRHFAVIVAWLAMVITLLSAAAPRKIPDLATVEELEAEITARLAELEPLLSDETAFAESKKQREQAASMLTVVAQALAEHSGDSKLKATAADLREGARQIAKAESLSSAVEGLTAAKSALSGESSGKANVEADWGKLARQRPLMEDIEAKMQQLQRALRRPKDPAKESLLATTVAIASLTTIVDTHEVKDPAQLPEWDKLAKRQVDELLAVSQAIKQKDAMTAQAQFKAARATCIDCHRQFKKEQ